MEISLGQASCTLEPFNEDGLDGKVKVLRSLYVPEAYRRQGYAKALLTHVCARADTEQYAVMLEPKGELDTKDLVAMYQSHGFTELQEEPLLLVRYPQEVPDTVTPKATKLAILLAH
jgi:GNAT superfamily N-acetyltransferase